VDDEGPGGPPGERRLARPPSERYRTAEEAPGTVLTSAQGVAIGALIAVLGGLAITFGGGLLAITAGLVVIAAAVGWGVATVLALGPSRGSTQTTLTSIALAVGGVALGQLGLWLLARQEGGVLGVVDYLSETFGCLVPLQFLAAAGAAWWRGR
jgi:hypothetical protein